MSKDWRDNLKFQNKKLNEGDTFYTYDGYKNHIIGFVDDKDQDEKIVVYKCWLKHKGYWGYYCKELRFILYEICTLYEIPKDKRVELFEMNEVDPTGLVKFK